MTFRSLFFIVTMSSTIMATGQSAQITLDATDLNPRFHSLIEFSTRSLLPHDEQDTLSYDGNRFQMSCDTLQEKYCQIFSKFAKEAGKLDFKTAQATWMEHYLDTRPERQNQELISDHLSGFMEKTNYKSWPVTAVDSRIKKTKRVIYRGLFENRQVSIAETWRDRGQGEVIEETEIAVEAKRDPGSFDFYVYDINGHIALESEFPAGVRPAPMICVSCHMNTATKKTSRFIQTLKSGH